MPGDLSTNLESERCPPPGRPAAPARPALPRVLERIRGRLHEHIDAIEALARAHGDAHRPDLERSLQQNLSELEQERVRFRAEAARWDQERRSATEALEHDRQLLAEAWERLEIEQVKVVGSTQNTARPNFVAPPVDRGQLAPVLAERDDPIARAILHQFQTLRRDVRRNAT
jgi:hypothetical protein